MAADYYTRVDPMPFDPMLGTEAAPIAGGVAGPLTPARIYTTDTTTSITIPLDMVSWDDAISPVIQSNPEDEGRLNQLDKILIVLEKYGLEDPIELENQLKYIQSVKDKAKEEEVTEIGGSISERVRDQLVELERMRNKDQIMAREQENKLGTWNDKELAKAVRDVSEARSIKADQMIRDIEEKTNAKFRKDKPETSRRCSSRASETLQGSSKGF